MHRCFSNPLSGKNSRKYGVGNPRTLAPPPATHWRAASWDSVYSRREDEDPPYELEQRDYRDWEGHERDRKRGLDGGGRRVGRGGRNARGWGAADKMDFTQVVGAAMRQELGVREKEEESMSSVYGHDSVMNRGKSRACICM